MSALQPWREQLRADPARVVGGVLDGWLDRGPWQRAEATDFLLDLAAADAALAEQTAAATLGWLRERLRWDERERLAFGAIAHASRLAEGFAVLQRLDAPRTAYQLAEQAAWFESRTRPLQFNKRLDLHRLFWLTLAFQQPDDRFLPRWLEFCGQAAGLGPGWQEWLRLGITGLRMLETPPEALPVDQHALAGLLLFHRRAKKPLPEEVEAFERQQLEVLQALFPRGPKYWPEKLAEARERWPDGRDLPVWMRGPKASAKKPSQPAASALPTSQEIRAMAQRIRREPPTPALWQAIAAWFQRCLDHAERTGDGEALTKTVGNFGDKFLKRRPTADLLAELLGWMRTALDWDRGDARRWTQLAACLRALHQTPEAEAVLWEALRRFPDNEICRTSLAEFLREQNRPDEAEALLRETIARFPDDDVCRNSLAEFLRDQNRPDEAEELLRETITRFPDDPVCRVSLAKLLREQNRAAEAEALLRETLLQFPDNVVCRNTLAETLINLKKLAEAQALLEENPENFFNNPYSSAILAKLLIRRGETEAAKKLLHDSLQQFPGNEMYLAILNALGDDEPETPAGIFAPQFGKGRIPPGGEIMLPPDMDEADAGKTPSVVDDVTATTHTQPSAGTLSTGAEEIFKTERERDKTEQAPDSLPPSVKAEKASPVAATPPTADPFYAWAAARAPITRLVFGFNREADIHQQLQAAAHSGGAAELAEVALRLLFPAEAVPLEDALRVRPGSPALRLLRAGPDETLGLPIAETAPEAGPVLRSLYQTPPDSSAWPPRFRAAVLALADLSPPPVYAATLA